MKIIQHAIIEYLAEQGYHAIITRLNNIRINCNNFNTFICVDRSNHNYFTINTEHQISLDVTNQNFLEELFAAVHTNHQCPTSY